MPAKKTKTHAEPDEEQMAALDKHVGDTLHKRKVLTAAVAIITVLIAGLWGFALRNQFSAISWNESSEKQMLDRAGDSWQEAKNRTQVTDEGKLGAAQTIKEKLMEIMAASASGTVAQTTSTAADTAASSTASTTL